MPYIVICAHREDEIFECVVYGRQLSPVVFEKSSTSLAVYQDPCTSMSQFCLVRCRLTHCQENQEPLDWNGNQTTIGQTKYEDNSHSVTTSEDPCEYIHQSDLMRCHVCGERKHPCQKKQPQSDLLSNWQWTDNTTSSVVHETSYIQLDVYYRTRIQLPANFAQCVFQELRNSKVFRRRFVRNVRRYYKFCDMRDHPCMCPDVHEICDYTMQLPVLVEVCVVPSDITVCLCWCYRLEGLLKKKSVLESTMACLSTLGGGYSSLGDYFTFHSEQAGKISVTQLRLSLELGDPIMAAKCRLFFALSLMQRGSLRLSKYIIRREFRLAQLMIVQDTKLTNMCQGLWTRLKFMYKNRSKQRRLMVDYSDKENGIAPIYYLLQESSSHGDKIL